jgi:hypothetical protein
MDSSSSAGLRIVDHVAGAVFQEVERGVGSYMDVIEKNVVHGALLRPQEAAPGWSVLATTVR